MLRSMTIRFSTLLLLGILLVPARTAAGAAANGVAASGPAVDFSRQTEAKGGSKKPYEHTGAPKKSKSSGGGNAGGGQPLPPSCPVGTCNTLQNKVEELENDVDGLKDEVEMTCPKEECSALQDKVKELAAEVAGLKTDAESTCPKETCKDLQDKVDEQESMLAAVTARLDIIDVNTCTDLLPEPLPSNSNVDVTYQLNLAGTACIPCYTGTAEDVTTACGGDCCAGGTDDSAACAEWHNTATICSGSCINGNGNSVCKGLGPGAVVGPESCNGADFVCKNLQANVTVGASSCNGNNAVCGNVYGSVGNKACNGPVTACFQAVCVGDGVQECDKYQICRTPDIEGSTCAGSFDDIPGLDLGQDPPNTCICDFI